MLSSRIHLSITLTIWLGFYIFTMSYWPCGLIVYITGSAPHLLVVVGLLISLTCYPKNEHRSIPVLIAIVWLVSIPGCIIVMDEGTEPLTLHLAILILQALYSGVVLLMLIGFEIGARCCVRQGEAKPLLVEPPSHALPVSATTYSPSLTSVQPSPQQFYVVNLAQ